MAENTIECPHCNTIVERGSEECEGCKAVITFHPWRSAWEMAISAIMCGALICIIVLIPIDIFISYLEWISDNPTHNIIFTDNEIFYLIFFGFATGSLGYILPEFSYRKALRKLKDPFLYSDDFVFTKPSCSKFDKTSMTSLHKNKLPPSVEYKYQRNALVKSVVYCAIYCIIFSIISLYHIETERGTRSIAIATYEAVLEPILKKTAPSLFKNSRKADLREFIKSFYEEGMPINEELVDCVVNMFFDSLSSEQIDKIPTIQNLYDADKAATATGMGTEFSDQIGELETLMMSLRLTCYFKLHENP